MGQGLYGFKFPSVPPPPAKKKDTWLFITLPRYEAEGKRVGLKSCQQSNIKKKKMKSDPTIPNKYWIGQKVHLDLCKMAWNNLNELFDQPDN